MERLVRKFTTMRKILARQHSPYTSFVPLHVYGKCLGFAPFTVSGKSFAAKFRPLDALFALNALAANAFVNYTYWLLVMRPSFLQSTVKFQSAINMSAPLVMFGQYLAYSAIMIASVARRADLCLILRKLRAIDADLEEFRVRFDYGGEQRFLRRVTLLVAAIIGGLMALSRVGGFFCDVHIDLKFDVYLLWILNCGAVLLLGFTAVAVSIRNRFRSVNACIESLNITQKSPSVAIERLRKLAAIHMQIVDTIRVVNRTFCIAMLSYFTLAFYWCCILLFIFIQTPAANWRKNHMFLLSKLMINGFMFGLLVTVIWSAAKVKSEGKETAKILYRIRNEVEVKEVAEKIMSFVDQVKFTPTKFSCGLFTFDWKLLFKFISAAVMYFVILVQFESSLHKCDNINTQFDKLRDNMTTRNCT